MTLMDNEVLVEVKPWVAERNKLHSVSFRAKRVHRTDKAVLLRLMDGREIWVPWASVERMEWAK